MPIIYLNPERIQEFDWRELASNSSLSTSLSDIMLKWCLFQEKVFNRNHITMGFENWQKDYPPKDKQKETFIERINVLVKFREALILAEFPVNGEKEERRFDWGAPGEKIFFDMTFHTIIRMLEKSYKKDFPDYKEVYLQKWESLCLLL